MSRWNHTLCEDCWNLRGQGEAIRMHEAAAEPCCRCGALSAAGIYVRDEPTAYPCNGEHGANKGGT